MAIKTKILIGILIIIISAGLILYFRKTCIGSNEQCKGKLDGTGCSTGVWCDSFGRVCGGQSCVGLGLGVCINNRCELSPYIEKQVVMTTDKTEYEHGEIIQITVKNNLDKSIWYEDHSPINYLFWGIEKSEKGKWEALIKYEFDKEEKTFPIAKFDFPFRGPWDYEKEGMCCASEGGGNCYRVYDRFPYDAKELKPSFEIFYEWNQKICPNEKVKKAGLSARSSQPVYFEPEFIGKGSYRIVFEYGLSAEEFPGSEMPEFRGGTVVKDKKTIYSNEFTIKEKAKKEAKNCDLYEMPMTEEQIKECVCHNGYKKFYRLSGAYCATNSQKPCSAHTDCPKGEHCISDDRKDWFCTGQFAGCYYRNPENPEEPMLCAD